MRGNFFDEMRDEEELKGWGKPSGSCTATEDEESSFLCSLWNVEVLKGEHTEKRFG